MFRISFLFSILLASATFASDAKNVSTYSLCSESYYDNIGLTTESLYNELSQVITSSSGSPYLEFHSKRHNELYRLVKPIAAPEFSRRQIGQQEYWICIKISEL